uniref:Peptidase aspartic putative domain-containing protein n=1 Tax=Amphimedon queenslandica TaxID=400682 RepID=A0A1X7UFD1_AMPQE
DCKGRHHTSICHKTQSSPEQTNSVYVQVNTSVLNPNAPPFSPPSSIPIDPESSHSSTLYTENDHNILLQTAHAIVFNPNNHDDNTEVRIILDCGSQHSYITNSLNERLHIKSD